MNSLNVISINPAQSAKSALHPEVFERIARECRFSRDVTTHKVSASKTINFIFGISKATSRGASLSLFALRTLLGVSMIAYTILNGISFTEFSPLWVIGAFGVVLTLGLFTRILSLGVLAFATLPIATAIAGQAIPDYAMCGLALSALIFLVAGPGKFSVDQIIRRFSCKAAKRHAHAKAMKLAQNRLSYKAMRYHSI